MTEEEIFSRLKPDITDYETDELKRLIQALESWYDFEDTDEQFPADPA